MSALDIPVGATIVHTFKQSFVDVPIDAENGNAIATTQFLDAAESLTTMFGKVAAITINGLKRAKCLIRLCRRPGLCCLLSRQERSVGQRQGTFIVC